MKTIDLKKKLEVLISCAGLAICSLGLIINVNGVFFKPLAKALGVGIGTVSITSTLTTLATGLASVYALKIIKIKDFRRVLLLSLSITVASTIGIALCKDLFTVYVLSIIRGIASCFFNTPVVTMIIGNWFISKRGTYSGVVMAFSGFGGALMSPILSNIIERADYRVAMLVCAAAMVLVSLPALFLLKASPQEEGYLPFDDGRQETERKTGSGQQNYSIGSHLFIRLMVVAFLCQSICSIAQHLSGYGESLGLSSSQGAFMISVAMIGNISGKFLVGFMADRIGEIRSGIVLVSGFLFGLLLLVFGKSYILLLIGSLFLGTSYASAVMLSNVTFAIYGNRQYGDAYAMLTLIINIGGAIAVALIGYAYDLSGSYKAILLTAILMCLIVLVSFLKIKKEVKNDL